MTKFEKFRTFLNFFKTGDIITRQEILSEIKGSQITTDNYRNWFTKAGYLKIIHPGRYKLLKKPPPRISSRDLRKEAYPNWRDWYEYHHLAEDNSSDSNSSDSDALNGLSVGEWERRNGRGFWGNSTTGYIYDKDINDRY